MASRATLKQAGVTDITPEWITDFLGTFLIGKFNGHYDLFGGDFILTIVVDH